MHKIVKDFIFNCTNVTKLQFNHISHSVVVNLMEPPGYKHKYSEIKRKKSKPRQHGDIYIFGLLQQPPSQYAKPTIGQ